MIALGKALVLVLGSDHVVRSKEEWKMMKNFIGMFQKVKVLGGGNHLVILMLLYYKSSYVTIIFIEIQRILLTQYANTLVAFYCIKECTSTSIKFYILFYRHFFSDDDDFYDRTKKPSNKKTGENQSIETADSLLDKRDAIKKEMEEKRGLLLIEENKMESHTDLDTGNDALDAYMSGLSSQLGMVLRHI